MKELYYPEVKSNLYQIDEYGNIYSNYLKDFMNPSKDKDGYLKITLRGKEKPTITVRVAKLVAYNYLSFPKELKDPTINHKDGNILNNHFSNLEWLERSKNASIRFHKGEGQSNSQSKLTEKEVIEICELLLTTQLTCQEIANIYSVTLSTIYNISKKKTWKSITNNYDFSCRLKIKDNSGKFMLINTNLATEKKDGN